MKKTMILTVVALLAVSLTAAAKDKHFLKLYADGTINGAALKAGEYRMEVDNGEAVFYKGRKEVARTAVNEKKSETKFDRNTVVYNGTDIAEIRLSGRDTRYVLEPGPLASKKADSKSKSN